MTAAIVAVLAAALAVFLLFQARATRVHAKRTTRGAQSLFAFGASAGALIVGAVMLLTGCAVVEEYRADGTLARRSLGVTPIVVAPGRDIPAVRVRALGAFYGAGNAVIGYTDATLIKPHKDCSAFIFVRDAREARRWAEYASEINGLCKGDAP